MRPALLALFLLGCSRAPLPAALQVRDSPDASVHDAEAPAAPLRLEVPQAPADHHPGLLKPTKAMQTAPGRFRVRFVTSRGPFVVEVHRDWAPRGVDRFFNLVSVGFYDNTSFYRTIDGFMAQFGISPYPAVNDVWRLATMPDDPEIRSNTRGRITFASAGPNTRTTQLFINYSDGNAKLDTMGFAAFGEVVEGMSVVDALYKTGECAPRGPGPNQATVQERGDAYLTAEFPNVDRILRAELIE